MINPKELIESRNFRPDELAEALYVACESLSKIDSLEARYIASELESLAIEAETAGE